LSQYEFDIKQLVEQKDYILREIEKIGLVLRAIRQKIFGIKDNEEIHHNKEVEEAKLMLFKELDIDLDTFLLKDFEETNTYLNNIHGFNVENIDQLADCIYQIHVYNKSDKSKQIIEKALQLYELSNLKSKTYSFEREKCMLIIKNAIIK